MFFFVKAILFIVLFFIIIVAILGFTIFRSFFKVMKGSKTASNMNEKRAGTQNNYYTNEKKKEKIFSKEEGEYIEFEEIDEDKSKQK